MQSSFSNQYTLCKNGLLGGSAVDGAVTYNPNPWIQTQRAKAVRIMPLGGAAAYPLLVECDGVTGPRIQQIPDSKFYDLGGPTQVRVVPQTMVQAFGQGAAGPTAGGLSDSSVTNFLFPAPTPNQNGQSAPAGSIANSAGYVSGRFLFSFASANDFQATNAGILPPYSWMSIYIEKLPTASPVAGGAIPLPDFINSGRAGTGAGGIAAKGAFMGAGQGVIRHNFTGAWTDAHTVYKWYIDPFSGQFLPGGSLNIGPHSAGGVAVIEETVNLSLPTWLYLQLDNADGSGFDVLWSMAVMQGGR